MIDETDPGAILRTEAARTLLFDRYFTSQHLLLDGVDGVDQHVDENGRLVGLRFPHRYGARHHPDVQATLHEMGHFITVPEHKAVRAAFGFGGGIPELGWEPWRDFHDKPVSHIPEAKAFAWEHILLQDLFGVDVPPRELVSSLRYAVDFFTYPGESERERIDFVEDVTASFIREYRQGRTFDELWFERVLKLPALITAENARMAALEAPAVSSTEPVRVTEDWSATIDEHRTEAVVAWRVTLTNSSNGDETSREFDTEAGASRWLARVVSAYAAEPEEAPGF